jgi:hypothetical protein
MNKQPKELIWIGIALIPLLIHFYVLDYFLINFANWGDDFIYLEYVKSLQFQTWSEKIAATGEFHSQIHRFPFSRLITAAYSYLTGAFHFKQLTVLANLQMALILIPIYGYIKRLEITTQHLIPLSCLVFAWNANLDNYSLIGALTHSGSILFLVGVAYLISSERWRQTGIWLSLLYPCIATEGFVFWILIGSWLIWQKDKRWIIYAISGSIIAFVYFRNYQSDTANTTEFATRVILSVKGIISYLGGSIKHDSIISLVMGSIFALLIYAKSKLYFRGKIQNSLFPLLILGQLIATAAMICWGRATPSEPNALFADRFNLYGGMVLVGLYLLYIDRIPKRFGILCVCIWYGLSAWVAYPKLDKISKRMTFEMKQAKKHAGGASYPYTEQYDQLLHQSGWYQFPKN